MTKEKPLFRIEKFGSRTVIIPRGKQAAENIVIELNKKFRR